MDEYFIEEKSAWEGTLDLLVLLSVFTVTIFLILDIIGLGPELDKIYLWISVVVLIIFALDLVRIWKRSNGFKDFLSHGWLDILATIPFELVAYGIAGLRPETVAAFGLLKWFRFHKLSKIGQLQRISRISKISKEFKAAAHLKREGEEYKRKHRL